MIPAAGKDATSPPDDAGGGALLSLLDHDDVPAPADLTDRVMVAVRRTVTPGALLDVEPARGGPIVTVGRMQVRTRVLADIARVAAAQVSGVRVVGSAATSRPDGVALTLDLVVELATPLDQQQPLPDVAVAVRRSVRRAVSHATGETRLTIALGAVDLLAPQLLAPDGV